MKQQNVNALEQLSLFSHFGGTFTVYMGIITILLNLLSDNVSNIVVGVYILAVGYALVKISAKISSVLNDEGLRTPPAHIKIDE